jgi:hypothetical protein
MGRASINAAAGALAGYVASRTMDAATTWFYGTQSAESKKREDEIAPGGALVQVGKQLGRVAGRDLDDEQAGRVGLVVHRTLGVAYGIAATRLVRRGMPPFASGVAVGTAAFVLVDEGMAITQFFQYPAESHLRGVVGHVTLGAAIGTLLSLLARR